MPGIGSHPHKLCIIDGVEYKNFAVAQRATGIKSTTIRYRCMSMDYPNYVCSALPVYISKREIKYPNCVINGVEYENVNEAGKTLNMSNGEIIQKMRSPGYPNYTCPDIPKEDREPCANRIYHIKGETFHTYRQAAERFGVSIGTPYVWIKQRSDCWIEYADKGREPGYIDNPTESG